MYYGYGEDGTYYKPGSSAWCPMYRDTYTSYTDSSGNNYSDEHLGEKHYSTGWNANWTSFDYTHNIGYM